MVAAYIRGFQGEHLGPNSVACMTKHFPGGGPQKDGGSRSSTSKT
jgi:beta-glucosidase